MIESHWDGIASYCHPENKVSLGLVGGVNNKIRVLQRRAYGLSRRGISQAEDRGGFPSAITQKCSFQPTRIRVDPFSFLYGSLTCCRWKRLSVHPALIARFRLATVGCFWPIFFFADYNEAWHTLAGVCIPSLNASLALPV